MAPELRELLVTAEDATQLEDVAQSEVDLERSNDQLRNELQVIQGDKPKRLSVPKLVMPDGSQIELPPHVLEALRFVVHHMAQGSAISLMPMNKKLTTREAANILGVSRPFLTRLLEQGDIPYIKIGTHHRVVMKDVLSYKKRRDEKTLHMIEELTAEAQEAGDYFG